jgi:acylphosphatase
MGIKEVKNTVARIYGTVQGVGFRFTASHAANVKQSIVNTIFKSYRLDRVACHDLRNYGQFFFRCPNFIEAFVS